jgi:GTP cyclohydrolase I
MPDITKDEASEVIMATAPQSTTKKPAPAAMSGIARMIQGEALEAIVMRLLSVIDPDPEREGLDETPKRVAKAWQFWTSGYEKTAEEVLKSFEDGAEGVDEMVIVKDIPFYSHCEHHLAPIFGTATVAYIPAGRIVGLSKLSRLVDIHARRLQVQERMTNDIANDLERVLQPTGVGVLLKARHLCMESRGVCQQGHHTITSALRGALRNDPSARQEFMRLST